MSINTVERFSSPRHYFQDTPAGGALTLALPAIPGEHWLITRVDIVGMNGTGTPTGEIFLNAGSVLISKNTGLPSTAEGEKDYGEGIAFPDGAAIDIVITRTSLTTGRLTVTAKQLR